MPARIRLNFLSFVVVGCLGALALSCAKTHPSGQTFQAETGNNTNRMVLEGQRTFRFDTFGSEAFWGDQLKLHQAIAGEKLGGVGAGISPNEALKLGLKVDFNSVPKAIGAFMKHGDKALDEPETTVALLKANAVVGLTGFFGYLSTVLSGWGLGALVQHRGWDAGFAGLIGVAAVGTLLFAVAWPAKAHGYKQDSG